MKPFPFSPARRDLVIKQGATWLYPITWERPAGTPVDISGFTARMQIRDDAYSSTVLVDMTTANGRITIDGPAGTVTFTAKALFLEVKLEHFAAALGAGGGTEPVAP